MRQCLLSNLANTLCNMGSICIFILLTGCDHHPEEQAVMQTYQERVANVLDQPIASPTPQTNFPALPALRERLQPTTDLREGLLDILELSECNLISLIAKRNSSLGKVSSPSQILIYEITFYQRLIKCIPILEKNPDTKPETIARLHHIAHVKLQEQPKYLWNALYTGQEIDESLALNQATLPLGVNNEHPIQNALTSWEYFAQLSQMLKQQDYSRANQMLTDIEKHMEDLYKNPAGTPLLRSLMLLTHYLNTTADVIEARLQRRPLCFNEMSNPKADILKTVFTRFYATTIQPYMATVHRLSEQWFSAHTKIREFVSPPASTRLYDAKVFTRATDISLWNQYINARNRHTQAWQHILSQCNLMPNANNR